MEPISGELGMPGSKYRLVPKSGGMVFVATVLAKPAIKKAQRRHMEGFKRFAEAQK